MSTATYIVDAFTDEPFKGNPAGVQILEQPIGANQMQRIASELNLSETAFVVNKAGAEQLPIRFFSPKMEIPLCGHATLSAAKVVLESNQTTKVHFRNQDGLGLQVTAAGDLLEMQFPAYDLVSASACDAMLAALGIKQVAEVAFNEELKILLLEIDQPDVLASLQPDFGALVRTSRSVNGVVVTAPAAGEFDFHSRYFWPWSGSDEDPVTGGTHTFLGKYWSRKLGKTKLKAFQSSARTGSMELELLDEKHMLIRGKAVIMLEGEMRI